MRVILLFFLNLFFITTLLATSYTSKVKVNLIRPIKIAVKDIDLGTYIIGEPKPKERHTKIVLEDVKENKEVDISVTPNLIMSANSGHDTINLKVSLPANKSTQNIVKTNQNNPETEMTISFETLPQVPGDYVGTITINADYN